MVNGSYKSGKTKLIPQIISGFREVANSIEKAEEEKQLRMKNLPTYTIQQILDEDSSSDEEDSDFRMNHFPWFKPGYQNIYDDLIQDPKQSKIAKNYPKAIDTDQKIILYENAEQESSKISVKNPKKFLIVTS